MAHKAVGGIIHDFIPLAYSADCGRCGEKRKHGTHPPAPDTAMKRMRERADVLGKDFAKLSPSQNPAGLWLDWEDVREILDRDALVEDVRNVVMKHLKVSEEVLLRRCAHREQTATYNSWCTLTQSHDGHHVLDGIEAAKGRTGAPSAVRWKVGDWYGCCVCGVRFAHRGMMHQRQICPNGHAEDGSVQA